MEYIEIPEFPRLRGEKAIDALSDFINEIEEQRGEELTEKQTAALIKLAKALISYIDAEIYARAWLDTLDKEMRFVPQLRKKLRNTFLNAFAVFP